MKNLLLTLLLFISSLAYSQTVIVDTLNCQGATITLTQTVPTNIDCDSIWGTHLFWINFPVNPTDSIETWWDIYFYNIVMEPISIMFPPFLFPQSGCYGYEVVLECQSGNFTTLMSTYYVSTLGIDELPLNKSVVRITDVINRECLPESNKLLIYHYSDGSTMKIFKQE